MTNYVATKYRFADGVAYRPNLYLIQTEERIRSYGGLVVLKDKALAYAGSPTLIQEKIGSIIASADAYAWGSTPAEALAKIKPHLGAR
jgi:hypothetical protein